MYGISALAACVGLWRMARWARPAYLTWCCCFVAHAMKLRYQLNPDNELKIWEAMATAYETFTASRNLTLDAKKEVFQVVLLRSGEPEEQVLQHLKLTALTQKDAREIMALFVEKPTPIEAIKQ